MGKGVLDPKVDFVFKNIFGSEQLPESEKVRNLEFTVKELREAKDELIKMSNDDEQRALYEMRSKILKDKVSALNKAKEEGREEGRRQERIQLASALLDILDDDTIAQKVGLELEVIQRLREKYSVK